MLAEVSGGGAPETDDLVRWVENPQEDLTFPILADPGWSISNRFERDFGIPTYSLISREMELLIVDGSVSASDIEDALAAPVPDVEWDQPPALEGGDDDAQGTDEDPDDEGTADAEPAEAGPFGGGEAPSSGGWVASPFGGCGASVAGQALPASWLLLLPALGLLRRRVR